MESWKSAKHGIVLCALYFVPGRWSLPASGDSVRHVATPTMAAVKTIRLRRMIPEGVCPRDTKTTTVAPIKPASVNSCQGCSASSRRGSIEVSELIVQAGVEFRIQPGHTRDRTRSLP